MSMTPFGWRLGEIGPRQFFNHDAFPYLSSSFHEGRYRANDDGSWTLVIAPEDPGPAHAHNWLDTGGRLEGYAILRWVLVRDVRNPECRVVPVESLRA